MIKYKRERSTIWIICELDRQGAPISQSISPDEFDDLIKDLVLRLSSSTELLNLEPKSLITLEIQASKYYLNFLEKEIPTQEEIARFVRELIAYYGKVILNHTEAELYPMGNLVESYVSITGKITGTKSGKPKTVSSILVAIGNSVAVMLDRTLIGNKEENYLFSKFMSIKNKHFDGI